MQKVSNKNGRGKTHMVSGKVFDMIVLTKCGQTFAPSEVDVIENDESPTCKVCEKKWDLRNGRE